MGRVQIAAWNYLDMINQRETKFVMMALAFPALWKADGIVPWNPNRLDIWAAEEADAPEAIAAVQYLLSLWNPGFQWQCGSFNPRSAFQYWDCPHRLAYLDWASRDSAIN